MKIITDFIIYDINLRIYLFYFAMLHLNIASTET